MFYKLFTFGRVVSLLVIISVASQIEAKEKDLHRCERTEACRVDEFHPNLKSSAESSGDGEQGSGLDPEQQKLGSVQLKSSSVEVTYDQIDDPQSFSYHEQNYFKISAQLCECSEDAQCPDENSTDDETLIKLDSFITLKLCMPKAKLPACRDHKRPVVRLFRDSNTPAHQSPGDESPLTKAKVWCTCPSGNFPRSRIPEVWDSGLQLATAYKCSPHKH